MARIVTLTTDFGLKDPYVGQMKAALLSVAPRVQIVDLTHEIAPQAVIEAAFVLETSWRYFPQGTIHVVVVDPGVGTSRRRIALAAGGHYFLGPDNGCLSAAVPEAGRPLRAPDAGYEACEVVVRPLRPVSIESTEVLPRTPSVTFEGRDVFAPVAGLLASGKTPLQRLGPRVSAVLAFPAFRAPARAAQIEGVIIRVDHFGNLITDVLGQDLTPSARVIVAGQALPIVHTYSDASGLAALTGSSGYLEIAVAGGSAAAALAAGPGTRVTVHLARGGTEVG